MDKKEFGEQIKDIATTYNKGKKYYKKIEKHIEKKKKNNYIIQLKITSHLMLQIIVWIKLIWYNAERQIYYIRGTKIKCLKFLS